jgi:hypothetical protein
MPTSAHADLLVLSQDIFKAPISDVLALFIGLKVSFTAVRAFHFLLGAI